MTVIDRHSWTRQPSYPVRLRSDHPLAPYCIGMWVADSNSVVLQRGSPLPLSKTGTTKEAAGAGPGVRFGSSYAATDIILLPDNDTFKFLNQNGSMIVGATCGTLSGSEFRTIWAIRNGSTQIASLVLGIDSGTYSGGRVSSFVGTDVVGTSGSAKQNAYAVYGVEWGTNGRGIYVNGALDTFNSGATQQITNSTIQPSLGNRITGGRPLSGLLHWWVGFNTNIGAEWHARIARDPFQLLEPRLIIIPRQGAAPALPTLTAISASNITSSGATLTITAS